jgi:hypothetical protein
MSSSEAKYKAESEIPTTDGEFVIAATGATAMEASRGFAA